MLRRAVIARHKHTYVGKVGAAAIDAGKPRPAPQTIEEEDRARSGVVHTVAYDPIASDSDFKARQEQSQFGAINQTCTSMHAGYAQHSSVLSRWMKVTTAAQILGMQSKQLFATKPAEIEDAWRCMYMKAANEREREEIMAAAEVMMEYCGSDEAKERTKLHFHEVLTNARREIDGSFKKDREDVKSRLMQGAAVLQLTISFFLIGAMWLMYCFLDLDDGRNMANRAKRRYVTAMSQPTNDEPAPNYVSRYRDTPTALEERAALPHGGVTDPMQRRALQCGDDAARREQGFIAQISRDMRGPGAGERIAVRRQHREDTRDAVAGFDTLLGVAGSVVDVAPSPMMRESRAFDIDGRNKACAAAVEAERLAAAAAAVAATSHGLPSAS